MRPVHDNPAAFRSRDRFALNHASTGKSGKKIMETRRHLVVDRPEHLDFFFTSPPGQYITGRDHVKTVTQTTWMTYLKHLFVSRLKSRNWES